MSTNEHDKTLPDGPRDEEYEAAWREMWGATKRSRARRRVALDIALTVLALLPIPAALYYGFSTQMPLIPHALWVAVSMVPLIALQTYRQWQLLGGGHD